MQIPKLPDMEFEIMKAIWQMEEPVTTPMLIEQLRIARPEKNWKAQTILTVLARLEKKGFLSSEKKSKERSYYVLVSQEKYLEVEAISFRRRFSTGKFTGLVKALCNTEELSEADIKELRSWLDSREDS